MPWARASALHRHLECPAASWLPRLERGVWRPGYLQEGVVELPPNPTELEDTSAADHGTAMHDAKANNTRAMEPYLSLVEPWREKLWPTELGVHEQLLAYSCVTGEVVVGPHNLTDEEAATWKAQWGAEWVVGTCDWWGNLPSGEPWISDLKTGWRTPEVVTPQTLFYLMLKCRVDGWDYGRVCIDHWPKREETPTREGLWRQVSGLVLDSFEDDLQTAYRRAVVVPSPAAIAGSHCQYCPSAGVCEKATGLDAEAAASAA